MTHNSKSNILSAQSIPRWALHRKLYHWMMSWAGHPFASWALFILSFAESSFFPIAPDVLQIALTMENSSKVWFYAAVNSAASVLGGCFGYFIGAALWGAVAPYFLGTIFQESTFDHVGMLYQQWDFWAIFVAAFTPIPYKVFTIAAGVFHISLPMFILASVVGRCGRFFLVAALLWWRGAVIKQFIERYFNILSLLLAILLLGGFVLIKSGIFG